MGGEHERDGSRGGIGKSRNRKQLSEQERERERDGEVGTELTRGRGKVGDARDEK